jgi:UDP-glucose 4-epimerase
MEKLLITGGTGTIGKELLKRLHNKYQIRVISRDELKQAKLKPLYPDVEFVITDVRDYRAVLKAMVGIDTVIHAAAMKRIEVCEQYPIEAVKTNILGTENVVNAAKERRVKKLISIGTDKGCEPINVYGMTKAIEEKITLSAGYNCARYGNVFGSRGSVVLLFWEQKQKGLSLTVTDPEMRRFILTTDEAINLLLLALNSLMEGTIFVKKSPAVKVGDMAKAFSENVKIIGSNPFEKKYEMLLNEDEMTRAIDKDGYYIINRDKKRAIAAKPYTSDNTNLLTIEQIKALIKKYVIKQE